ncbi:KIFC1 [Branchiostoma lanceolatum]|uniref:Kinesin-like protein n=1 Tax=Branchiostoma lanceolatum TaxID=7740 RepID=A0A8J9ZX40_BRALA|nr:KIFC1 [Branchiostoma lanceolatum]
MSEAPRSPLITLNGGDGQPPKAVAAVKPQPQTPAEGKSRLPQPQTRLPMPSTLLPVPRYGATKRKQDFTPEVSQAVGGKKRKADTARAAPPPKMPNIGRRTATAGAATRPGTRATAAAKPPVARPTAASRAVASRGAAAAKTAVTARCAGAKPAPKAGGMTRSNSGSTIPKGAPGKKRPAWDLKGRIEDMEKTMRSMKSEKEAITQQKEEITQHSDHIQQGLQTLQQENASLKQRVQEREAEVRDLQSRIRNLEDDVERVSRQKKTLERERDELESDLQTSRQTCQGLKGTIAQQAAAQEGIKAELQLSKSQLETTNVALQGESKRADGLQEELARAVKKVEEQHMQLQQAETDRRVLHNTIQELKGNIRVFARLRPLLSAEGTVADNNAVDDVPHFDWHDGNTLELDKAMDGDPNETMSGLRRTESQKVEFNFDRVFAPSSSQAEVFEEISQLVQSALDGYNVCIFAYGQTGSGKTHTMEGIVEGNPEQRGMIPRAVEQVFHTAEQLKTKGWEYKITASFLEIYNESLRDLLDSKPDKKMDIKINEGRGRKDNKTNDVHVTNQVFVDVTSEAEVHPLLKKANKHRAVAATKCNDRSSRSHSVFQLRIKGENRLTAESCSGMLNLIDLAGSEQIKKSGSQGKQLQEAQSINKSLSALSLVITALSNKDPHIPYRNSKLTYLLQNSLGGNSKTLMFVNVSPQEEHLGESINSLRFATAVNQCNIGTAQKKVK